MNTRDYDEIVVVGEHTNISFQDDYPAALRCAVGLVRDGIAKLEVQQFGTLHTYEEIQAASDALDKHFTDEDLIEEVHHASKVRAGRG